MIEGWQYFGPIEAIKPSIDPDYPGTKIIYLLKDLDKHFLVKAVAINGKLDQTNRKYDGS
jgi:hypothetical protein